MYNSLFIFPKILYVNKSLKFHFLFLLNILYILLN